LRRGPARRVFKRKTRRPPTAPAGISTARAAPTTPTPRRPIRNARLYRKTSTGEARLAYLGHLQIENRHGLIVDAMATAADGTAERDAAMLLLPPVAT
jgi:hypothetical protein